MKKQLLKLFIIPALLILVLLGGTVFEKTGYYTDGPMMPVRKGMKVFSVFGAGDTIVTTLAAGDSVRFIGYNKAFYQGEYLVETTSGVRGWTMPWMLDIEMIAEWKDLEGDTLILDYPKKIIYNNYGPYWDHQKSPVTGQLLDGTKLEDIRSATLYPAIKDFRKYEINWQHAFSKIMSKKKFEKLAKDMKFEKSEKKIGPMYAVARLDNGDIEVRYRTYVFDPEDGKCYNPIVTFGADSVAIATGMREASDRGDWVLKRLPLVSAIYDFPLTSAFARTPVYDMAYDSKMSTPSKIIFWICWGFSAIGALLWIFAVGSIPLIIVYELMWCPKVFYYLSDRMLKVLMALVAIVFTYYWVIVLMGWGAYWWIIPLVGFATYVIYFGCSAPLDNTIPHSRCQECRSMDTMNLVEKEFLGSENAIESRTRSHELGSTTKRWKTWTRVSSDGGQSWHDENVKHHFEKDTRWRDDHYREKVRYDKFMLHYKCSVCGYHEQKRDQERHILDRKYTGSSDYTTHSSSED